MNIRCRDWKALAVFSIAQPIITIGTYEENNGYRDTVITFPISSRDLIFWNVQPQRPMSVFDL